jgi:hypothetical protein
MRECVAVIFDVQVKEILYSRSFGTVDSPEKNKHPPDPGEAVTLNNCSISGKVSGCVTARPPPQKSDTLRKSSI